MKSFAKDLYQAALLFKEKKVGIFAAASSYYFSLTIIPLSLLLIRVLGVILGDISLTQQKLFNLLRTLLPEINIEIFLKLEAIIKGPLYGLSKFTHYNFLILALVSLSFFNSIWVGLSVLTSDVRKSLWVRLKGLSILALTMALLGLILIVPPILRFMENFLKNNELITFLKDNFPKLTPLLNYFSKMDLGVTFIIQSNLIPFILFLIYFSLLYRWFFHWKISFKESLKAGFVFVLGLIIGKNVMYWYFKFAKGSMQANFGELYIYVVAMIWIFLVMCFFFYGAGLCHIYEKKNKEKAIGTD